MTKTPDPSLGVDRVVIRPCDYCGRQQTEDDIRLDDDETKWCYWLECECAHVGLSLDGIAMPQLASCGPCVCGIVTVTRLRRCVVIGKPDNAPTHLPRTTKDIR